MLYNLEYRNSEMHREGSPLTPVIGSTVLNTENGSTMHTGTDSTPSECGGRTMGSDEGGPEHDWIWGGNSLHPYPDSQSRSQVTGQQGQQEVLGASNNGYLPSSHYHHHHHHHLSHPTMTSSTGLYMHNHHHHHHPNNHHHHHTQQQQQQQTHRNSGNHKYILPGSKPDERSPHHPALSLSVGYNAAAVAAAAAIAAAVNSSGPPGVTLSTGKPKRRRIPTVAQRRAANIRERRRMFNLNEAFDTLRKRVPTFAYEKRLSRIETLRLAITYISFMTDVISGKEPGNIKLHGTKTFTWEALHPMSHELNLHGKGPNLR